MVLVEVADQEGNLQAEGGVGVADDTVLPLVLLIRRICTLPTHTYHPVAPALFCSSDATPHPRILAHDRVRLLRPAWWRRSCIASLEKGGLAKVGAVRALDLAWACSHRFCSAHIQYHTVSGFRHTLLLTVQYRSLSLHRPLAVILHRPQLSVGRRQMIREMRVFRAEHLVVSLSPHGCLGRGMAVRRALRRAHRVRSVRRRRRIELFLLLLVRRRRLWRSCPARRTRRGSVRRLSVHRPATQAQRR